MKCIHQHEGDPEDMSPCEEFPDIIDDQIR